MSSSTSKKNQHQSLNHAWLDGTEQPPHAHAYYQPNHAIEFGNDDGDPNRPISLTEPLLLHASSKASVNHDTYNNSSNTDMNDNDVDCTDNLNSNRYRDPLSSPHHSSSSSSSSRNDGSRNVMMENTNPSCTCTSTTPTTTTTNVILSAGGNRNSNNKKMVRFHTDVEASSHEYTIQNNQLRQRNCNSGTAFVATPGSNSSTRNNNNNDATASSFDGGRLLNRYHYNNSTNGIDDRNGTLHSRRKYRGGGRHLWNVQHIHHKFRTMRSEPEHHDPYQEVYHDDDNDNDDDLHHLDHEDDPNVTTNQNHRHGTDRGYYGYRTGGCYEFWNTWFYTLAYQRTIVLIFILFTTYTCIVVFYATIYYTMSRIGQAIHDRHPTSLSTHDDNHPHHSDSAAFMTTTISNSNTTGHTTDRADHTLSVLLLYLFCDMDLHTPMEAMFFSLSTMASIGYGVSDYYFGNCGLLPLFIVLLQICTAICYDAIAIGLLFQRLRRSHKRSKSILFTNTAIVQRIQTIPYLMIRIAELRHYPLVNATIRAYCIYHDRYPIANTFTNTNDNTADLDLESTTTTPPTIVATAGTSHIHTTYYVTKPVILQQHDILMNIPQVIVHPIRMNESPLCPPSIWYDMNGTQHTYSQPKDPHGTDDSVANPRWMQEDMEQIQLYINDRNMEVIIVIEGTDELTGTCTQTKQSYTYQDIQWNQQFVSCMYPATTTTITSIDPDHRPRNTRSSFRNNVGGGCIVDFASFHSVEPAPLNSDFCPYAQK
jgi:Inward rectifier potassium channel C-terminal domain